MVNCVKLNMQNFFQLKNKGQTSFEYLFLIGGLILLAVIVISIFQINVLPNVNSQIKSNTANLQKLDCLKYSDQSLSSVYANYQLDENSGPNLSDLSGNSYNLPIHNPPWQTTSCKDNGCISLVNPEFVNITNSSSLDGSSNYTVEFWINDSGTAQSIYSTSNAVNSGFSVIDSSSGNIAVNCSGTLYTSNTSVNDGNWHYVQASLTPTSVQIYQDGQLTYTNNAASCTLASTTTFNTIGASCSTYSSCYDYLVGSLDELNILSYAESATDANNDYQFYLAGNTPSWQSNPSYLSAQYHFDDGSGVNVSDSSSNGNYGNLQNVFNDRVSGSCDLSNCFKFDGSSIYGNLNAGTTSSLSQLSVDGFVNASSASGQSQSYIISQEDPSQTSGWAIGLLGTSNVCPNSVPGMLFFFNGTSYVCSNSSLFSGWKFFAVTNNNSITSIYVNGVLVNSASQTLTYSSGANLSIGAFTSPGTVSDYLNGSLNGITVYSSALTSGQINSDYTCSG